MFKIILATFILISSFNLLAKTERSEQEIDIFFQKLSMISFRLKLINSNIENAKTTRTAEGGEYKVKVIKSCDQGFCEVYKDLKSPIHMFDPEHPDADEKGYVKFPNINIMEEMNTLVKVHRAREFLMDDMPVSKAFFHSKDMKKYLDRYPGLRSNYDFDNIIKNKRKSIDPFL